MEVDKALAALDKPLPGWSWFKSLTFFMGVMIQVFGNGLCLTIWCFERYGGDPHKRTILNQLIGQLLLSTVSMNVTGLLAFMLRLVVGPIASTAVEALYFIGNTGFGMVTLFALNEIAVIRFMSIFWWKRLPPISDDFFGILLWLTNISLSFFFASAARLGYTEFQEMYLILTGLPDTTDTDFPNFRYVNQ